MPLPLIPLVGGFSGLVFGVMFGSVSTRRAGTAFAMISLGLANWSPQLRSILRGFFGGEEGVTTNRTKLLPMFGLNFGPQIQVYYLIAAWCLLCVVAMYALTRTPLGRMCNAVRDNPERAAVRRLQSAHACASSRSASPACSPASPARWRRSISRSPIRRELGAAQSGRGAAAAYIGGVGNFIGPIIGAILVT